MNSSIDKIKEKMLLESLANKDFNAFKSVFNDVVNEQYSNIVNTRINQHMGIKNV